MNPPRGLQDPETVTKATEAAQEPVPEGHPDADLYELVFAWRQVFDEAERLYQQGDEPAQKQVAARGRDIERQILAIKAQTVEGVVAKLRMVSVIWGDDPDDPEQLETTDQRIMCSAVIDAGSISDSDAALFRLIAEVERVGDELGNAIGERFHALAPRSKALDDQAMGTPPRTVRGLAWKLGRLNGVIQDEAGVSEWTRKVMQTVVADAERLAKGGVS